MTFKRLTFLVTLILVLITLPTFVLAQSRRQRPAQPVTENQQTAPPSTDAEQGAPSEAKSAPDNNATASKDPFENFRFRNLGPAVGGGRVTSVVGVPGKPNIYYVGAAAGGVFRTQDGGLTWRAIFEKQPVASIGAVALAPSNPNLVWVGTGESNIRNDVSTGHGVYLSPDGGSSWRFMGLKDVGQISTIIVDPNNAAIVFVGAVGHAWGPNPDRGVFRTTDGGRSWQKVLYVDQTTGVSSLVMDPGNPMVLYAGLWQVQRFPWMLVSGGPSGGIYRSTDGGSTWKKLTDGLPEGPVGRIGLAVAPSNPRHLYALVEAKKGVLWDSNDFGDHWKEVSNNHVLNARPFYFSTLSVSPEDESKIYFLSFDVVQSTDGGKTARVIGRRVHPDNHSIWIDPKDPQRVILGNDGGVYLSTDAGQDWRYLDNLPIEQFYQVATDDQTPYVLCGGLQDNNGWCGPSNSTDRTGITGADWFTVTGGDGEYVVPAPGSSHLIYADSQNGSIQRLDSKTGLSTSVRPYLFGAGAMKTADLKYRFNWTSPIAVSAHDPNEVYLGGNVLFKSNDGGAHWNPISPDLTRNDKSKQLSSGGPVELDLSGAETFDTILSFALSPLDAKTIWAGTDDGLVQLTRDGGQSWTNVTTNIHNLPEWGRVQQIEASPSSPGTCYVAFDFHEVDNNHPYVFKTGDFGKTWTSIAQGLPADEPARVVRENPNRKGFLVLGTETGLFYSVDDGANWNPLKSNFPTVPVYDLKFVKKTHDLVVATHGRGLFVLDNITPIEELNPQMLKAPKAEVHVFSIPAATNWHLWNKRGYSSGAFVTPNPPNGAVIDYYLPAEMKASPEQRRRRESPVKLVITDSSGQTVRTMYGPSNFGFNRAVWNLRYDGPKRLNFLPPPSAEEETNAFFDPSIGPPVLPGGYNVAVTINGKTETRPVQVGTDPRLIVDLTAFKAQVKAGLEARDALSALNEALNRTSSLHKQITNVIELLSAEDSAEAKANYKPVLDQARSLDKKLTEMETPIYNREIQPGASDRVHFLERFHDRMQSTAQSMISGYGQAPSELLTEQMATLRPQLEQRLQEFNQFMSTEVAAFNRLAMEHGTSTLFAGPPIQLKSTSAQAGGN